MSFSRFLMVLVLGSSLAAASAHNTAQAQEFKPVESTVQGTVGLGLIGLELGLLTPAVVGLHDNWAFVVFPIAFAGGGAAAGYFLIDDPGNIEAGVGVLAGGLALLLPSLVATLALTAYDPEDEDGKPTPAVPSNEGDDAQAKVRDGSGFVRYSDNGGVRLGVPGAHIAGTHSVADLRRYSLKQQAELRVPLVSGSF